MQQIKQIVAHGTTPPAIPLGAQKHRLSDLAVNGGFPSFLEPLHVGRPNLGDKKRFLSRVSELLDRNWLTNAGPLVNELELRIADMVGAKHCIVTCNGTVSLEIAIRAAGLKGEVIVPAFTFVATAHALQWQEITPVFCDVDPRTHNIDPARVEELITPKTTGIIGVHLWGRPCDVEALAEIAERRKLKLMFDASHAFACSHEGRIIGGFGLAEVFSFHATKFFNTFEGGAIVTNNDELAAQIRLMKNFGFAGYDNVIYVGTNGKMTEICAAMGLTNLESLDDFVTANRSNYEAYQLGLSGIPGLSLIRYSNSEKCNYQYIVVEVDEVKAGLSRDELVQVLHAENILARRYFFPGCHRLEPYLSNYPHARLLLPETEKLAHRVLLLPSGTAVSPAEIEVVCSILDCAIRDSLKVRKRLRGENGTSQAAVIK